MSKAEKPTRDAVAEMYAEMLAINGPDKFPHWQTLNALILSVWSQSGLTYIKTKAWDINENGTFPPHAASPQKGRELK